jgi:hypothetical protein
MNITLFNLTTTVEGSLAIGVQVTTKYDTRIDLGKITNERFIQASMNSINDAGVYHFEMFYQNPNSFEFRSMFSISNQYNITFVNPTSISLLSDRNIFYANSIENLTVQIDSIEDTFLNEEQFSKILCKLGNEYLNTTRLSTNNFLCQFIASKPRADKLSMIYKSSDALDGEITISNNQIDILFIGNLLKIPKRLENISILAISPFASLKSSLTVLISSNFSNIYGSLIKYQCVYGNSRSDTIFISNQFNCSITKLSSNSVFNISLMMISKLKNQEILFSINSLPFYFMGLISFKLN